jgi:hypothetical protein
MNATRQIVLGARLAGAQSFVVTELLIMGKMEQQMQVKNATRGLWGEELLAEEFLRTGHMLAAGIVVL